jgi:hypothetical protein
MKRAPAHPLAFDRKLEIPAQPLEQLICSMVPNDCLCRQLPTDGFWPVSDLRSRRTDASFSPHLQSSSALQRKDSGREWILLDDF